MLTANERHDVGLRLEAVISEYAAASQRNEAVAKVHTVLDRVTEATPAEPEPAVAQPEQSASPDETTHDDQA